MINRAYTFSLDVNNALIAPPMLVKQGDTATVLNISLLDNFEPIDLTELSVKFAVQKPDGIISYQNMDAIEATTGKVTIIMKAQTLSVAGTASAELSIYGADNQVITMFAFDFDIDPIIDLSGAVIAGDELPLLTPVFSDITALQTEIANHESRVLALELVASPEDLTALVSDVAELMTDDIATKANVSDLQTRTEQLETAVGNIDFTNNDSTTNQIAALTISVETATAQIADLELEKHTHTNKDTLDKIPNDSGATAGQTITKKADGTLVWQLPSTVSSTDITTLQGRATALETDNQANKSAIVTLQTSDTAQSGRITAIETAKTTDESNITALQTDNTSNKSRLTAVETVNGTQNTDITSLKSSRTTDESNITTLQGASHTHINSAQIALIPSTLGSAGQVLKVSGSTMAWGTDNSVDLTADQTATGMWSFTGGTMVYSKVLATNAGASTYYVRVARVKFNSTYNRAMFDMPIGHTGTFSKKATVKAFLYNFSTINSIHSSSAVWVVNDFSLPFVAGDIVYVPMDGTVAGAGIYVIDIFMKVLEYAKVYADNTFGLFENGASIWINPDSGSLLSALPVLSSIVVVNGTNCTVGTVVNATIKTTTLS